MLEAELGRYLQAQGIGTFDETGSQGDIFTPSLPSSPDEAIAIRRTGGTRSGLGNPIETPTLQVLVRGGTDPRAGEQRAVDIYNLLHGFMNARFDADGTWIISCQGMQSGPIYAGVDENGRHAWSLNFELIVQNDDRRN